MKKLLTIAGLLCAALAYAESAIEFKTPILLTSCGQSADGLSMKLLLQRDSLAFDYQPQATVAQLEGKGSLIIVIGGSSKGLGAAKISAEDEMNRVKNLIDAAQKAGVPILVAHMGGATRRGSLSDPFNALGAEHADHLIVVKGGNDDNFFSKISAEREIPLETAVNALQVGELLKSIYK